MGRDVHLVEMVKRELNQLQLERNQARKIAQVAAAAKKTLRIAKRQLEPVLQQLGFHYHGALVRKNRSSKKFRP